MEKALGWVILSLDILDSVNPDRIAHESEAIFRNALTELQNDQPDYISVQVMYSQAIRLLESKPQPNFPKGGISHEGHKNNYPLT